MFGKESFTNFMKSLTAQPQLQVAPSSLLPDMAANEIRNGRLPHLNTDTILLSVGEVCHFIDRATLVKEKNVVTGYEGGSSGWSFRVFKGVNYRIGRMKGSPIRGNVLENTNGLLYFTNRRVIFVAKSNGFDKEIGKITALVPFSNSISIQIGSSTYSLLMPKPEVAFAALQLLKP